MNGTPRLRSAFPSTPSSSRRPQNRTQDGLRTPSSLPDVSLLKPGQGTDGPLIPYSTAEAPQQRLYVFAFYLVLLMWRLYDFHYLQEEDTESLWMFMKWVAIDGVFLFGLPSLRIPWLEWSSATVTVLFLAHALLDGVLMFRIPIPFGSVLVLLSKVFYDREMAISERAVKQSSILHNSSLILGKQIIHILPEGSATLNPGKKAFCMDSSKPQMYLPIQVNQTRPVGLDILRIDLDTNANETIHLGPSQLRKMLKEAQKRSPGASADEPLVLRYPVKATGEYSLQKVVDESKLEVTRRRVGRTIVVPCPQAAIKPVESDKCKGELSNVEIEVRGTPPLRVKYRRLLNQGEQEAFLQSIQPDDFVSPLTQQESAAVTLRGSKDISWAQPRTVPVPLSESLGTSGKWVYSLEEVQDGFGNVVSYSEKDHDGQDRAAAKSPHLHQVINVHERPVARLHGCDSQRALQVAKGKSADLPVDIGSTGRSHLLDAPFTVEYIFTPEEDMPMSGEHSDAPQLQRVILQHASQKPQVQRSGLYSLSGISSNFCRGEVLEPSSCLLHNPPEPGLRIDKEEIFDKCAHKAIGLRVDFHLTGTPPFDIQYLMERRDDGKKETGFVRIEGLRGQTELTPPTAGRYTYRFSEISDATYKGYSLGKDLVLEQDVKPSAYASFTSQRRDQMVCIDQKAAFDIALRGEGPFTIEYELVRGSDRRQHTVADVHGHTFRIETDVLTKGGDYTLALASVTDSMGCKEFLKEQAKINVRHQRPKVAFGHIEGDRTLKTLEHKKVTLPVRLTGEAPWTVAFRNTADDSVQEVHFRQPNDKIVVDKAGTYELLSIRDSICPGAIDESASKFDVHWIPRPGMQVAENTYLRRSEKENKFVKHDVCEGDEDTAELHLQGAPPFDVKYEERLHPDRGQQSLKKRALNAALGMTLIRMDTSQPGQVEYRFSELGDNNYDHESKRFRPLVIEQRVHPRPLARFANPGKTYSFCSIESSGEEVIPITLTGQPPFSIDVELKHHGTARPEIISIPNIPSTSHDLRIPHSKLHLGISALTIRKVKDSRGCARTLDSSEPRVQLSVNEPPQIRPLEVHEDFCVGERISFSLSGQAPFQVFYEFNGQSRKASSTSTTFRRLAEKPGVFTITGITDSASKCRADTQISRHIHSMPSVRVSKGRDTEVDIHEGGEAEITFDFAGVPPFEFTWTRSTNARKGQKSTVLEMRSESTQEYSMSIRASEEGTYEVVAIKDRHCAYAKEGIDVGASKLLTF